MVKENQNLELLNQEDLKGHETFNLINCIVNKIDLIGVFELNAYLILENCIINNLQIHSCWFTNGLLLKNCIIKNYIDYQMGGHNVSPIVIEGNVFMEFFNFFDCQFENRIEVVNNVFIKGTNLLGNKGEGFENSFAEGWLAENNVGNIDLNEVEVR
ncbi:hypothetical protein MMU07_18325 [Aquiflexum sp. LQ15W]|uniref:hypothetical protein n=1 Tax=Cognataquiflexum nitidum TaxID=2922272 RepID=UPI001F148D9A|nr:hypothetical protein [Cognataquiflexum nitidum]MCH6201544.1 hypothetical protein [Cognataquiflexum nitidum]